MKKQKGITLIALVITIIVLLILAGISISLIAGDNGILTKTTTAKVETRGSQVEEQVRLWEMEKASDKNTGDRSAETLEEIVNRLVKENLLTENEKDQILGNEAKGIEGTGEITIGSKTIIFGTEKTTKTLVQAFKDGEINVGDYITNYNSTLNNPSATVRLEENETGFSGVQEYKLDNNTIWRVLGLSEDKAQLIITTESPIEKIMKEDGEDWEKDPYLYLKGAEAWYYGGISTENNILDKISSIYDGKYAELIRSMSIEDINKILEVKVIWQLE